MLSPRCFLRGNCHSSRNPNPITGVAARGRPDVLRRPAGAHSLPSVAGRPPAPPLPREALPSGRGACLALLQQQREELKSETFLSSGLCPQPLTTPGEPHPPNLVSSSPKRERWNRRGPLLSHGQDGRVEQNLTQLQTQRGKFRWTVDANATLPVTEKVSPIIREDRAPVNNTVKGLTPNGTPAQDARPPRARDILGRVPPPTHPQRPLYQFPVTWKTRTSSHRSNCSWVIGGSERSTRPGGTPGPRSPRAATAHAPGNPRR